MKPDDPADDARPDDKGQENDYPERFDPIKQREYLSRVRTFEPTPAGFNPLKASARELAVHGFPRKPDEREEPHLHDLWHKTFRADTKMVRAELVIAEPLLRRLGLYDKYVHDVVRSGPSGWGGVVAQTAPFKFSPPEPCTVVYGEWEVPDMTPDFDNPTMPMIVGFWVGIDGFNGGNQVLQAGTAATVTGVSMREWAWFEWFPAPSVEIQNFLVHARETMTALVCAVSTTQGWATLVNKSLNVATTVSFPAPPGIASLGASAEWIVEGVSPDLPQFSTIAFKNITAGTKSHHMDLSKAVLTNIRGAGAKALTSTFISEGRPVVKWEGLR